MPTPPTMRYATNSANVAETAQPNADTVNSTADSIIERFLPMLSPSIPATDTPKMLPTRAQPTYHTSLSGVRPKRTGPRRCLSSQI